MEWIANQLEVDWTNKVNAWAAVGVILGLTLPVVVLSFLQLVCTRVSTAPLPKYKRRCFDRSEVPLKRILQYHSLIASIMQCLFIIPIFNFGNIVPSAPGYHVVFEIAYNGCNVVLLSSLLLSQITIDTSLAYGLGVARPIHTRRMQRRMYKAVDGTLLFIFVIGHAASFLMNSLQPIMVMTWVYMAWFYAAIPFMIYTLWKSARYMHLQKADILEYAFGCNQRKSSAESESESDSSVLAASTMSKQLFVKIFIGKSLIISAAPVNLPVWIYTTLTMYRQRLNWDDDLPQIIQSLHVLLFVIQCFTTYFLLWWSWVPGMLNTWRRLISQLDASGAEASLLGEDESTWFNDNTWTDNTWTETATTATAAPTYVPCMSSLNSAE